jgi:hypothetical protein
MDQILDMETAGSLLSKDTTRIDFSIQHELMAAAGPSLRLGYSGSPIAVHRKHDVEWLFP